MPRVLSVAPCFAVANVGATMRWYKSNLGFSGDAVPDSEPFVFAILRLDRIEIMLQRVADYEHEQLYDRRNGGVWNAYIRLNGVKEFYEAIKDKVNIKRALHRPPYGQIEFEVEDPNGYILVFSEPFA